MSKPIAPPVPEPPEHLPPAAADEWQRVAPELASRGPIRGADQALLAAYCAAFGDWQRAREEVAKTGPVIKAPSGGAVQNPWLTIANAAEKRMHSLLRALRLTPDTRPYEVPAYGPDDDDNADDDNADDDNDNDTLDMLP